MQEKVFDVGKFINNQRIGTAQFMVMLCAAIMTVDGYDVFVMGFGCSRSPNKPALDIATKS
jgi:hypothetical protein